MRMTEVGASLSICKERELKMAPVIDVTREVLVERRRMILDGLGMDGATFADLAETCTLTGDEWEAKEELDGIAFLLGDD